MNKYNNYYLKDRIEMDRLLHHLCTPIPSRSLGHKWRKKNILAGCSHYAKQFSMKWSGTWSIQVHIHLHYFDTLNLFTNFLHQIF